MTNLRKAAQQALETLEEIADEVFSPYDNKLGDAILALRAALAQQDESEAYGYASRLAVAIWEKHYKDTAPQWKPLDYLIGVLTQIDNMTSGLTRQAQQDGPHPDYPCRSDGRCQYAIDHGAEGLGSCPKGKCAMAQPQPAEDRAVAQDNLRVMREMFGEQAEPVQEPVAWLYEAGADRTLHWHKPPLCGTPLYLAPPQRKPLTDEEIRRIIACIDKFTPVREGMRQLARAIERAHGIGEHP